MKIGDVVKSKTVSSLSGTIIGAFSGRSYADQMKSLGIEMSPWAEKCPNWQKRTVYAVLFSIPIRSCTFEQWVEHAAKKGISKEESTATYCLCPEVNTMAFPENDLEHI